MAAREPRRHVDGGKRLTRYRIPPKTAGDYQATALRSPLALQRFWHEGKLALVDSLLTDAGTALDVGCGSGNHLPVLERHHDRAIGLDLNVSACHFTAQHYPGRVVCGDGTRLPFASQAFDTVLLLDVVEHFEQPRPLLAELHRCLAPKGRLVLTTPNYGTGYGLLERAVGMIAPSWECDSHPTKLTRGRLERLASETGFSVTRIGSVFSGSLAALIVSSRAAHAALRREQRAGIPPGLLLYAVLEPAGGGAA